MTATSDATLLASGTAALECMRVNEKVLSRW